MTKEGIRRDYPKEIVSARSQLWPRYKQEREKNTQTSVQMGFTAKILVHVPVNGRVIEDKFPDWFNVLCGSRHEISPSVQHDIDPNGTAGPSQHISHSNGPKRDPLLLKVTPMRTSGRDPCRWTVAWVKTEEKPRVTRLIRFHTEAHTTKRWNSCDTDTTADH